MFQTRFSKSKSVLSLSGLALLSVGFYCAGSGVAKISQPKAHQPVRMAALDKTVDALALQRLQPVPGARKGSFEEMSRVMTRADWSVLNPEQRDLARQMLETSRANKVVPTYCFRADIPVSQQRAINNLGHALNKNKENFQPYFGRWDATATTGGFSFGSPFTLTWNLAPDSATSDIRAWAKTKFGSEEAFRDKVRAMFALWSSYLPITYVEVPYDDGADAGGELGKRPDIRISGAELTGGAVGINFNPPIGDMVIHTKTDYFDVANDPKGERLFNTMTHEHGHGLGLSHTCPQDGTKVMEPAVNEAFHGAQFDDILSAQFLYGDAYEKGSRNNTPASAFDLGTMKLDTTTTVTNASLNRGDVDYYKITPDSNERSVTVTLKPAGAPYQEGSCDAPEGEQPEIKSFDPTKTRNLNLEIVTPQGVVVASSAISPAGGTEKIEEFDLISGVPYSVRVWTPDNGDKIQAYTLDLKIGPPKNQPPVISNLRFEPRRPLTNSTLKALFDLSDPEGATVSASTVWRKNGVVISVANNTIDLASDGAINGDVYEVTVTAKDPVGSTTTAKASVVVRPVNVKPSLNDATFSTRENKSLNAKLVATDPNTEDPNAEETLTYRVTQKTKNGTLVLTTDGEFDYTPKLNYNGSDSFVVRVSDQEGLSQTATVTINITSVNNKPIVQDDIVNTKEDVVLTIPAATLLKNDNNGEIKGEVDPISISGVIKSVGFPGSLVLDKAKQTILFTPKTNWNGTTSFDYTVQDSAGNSSKAKVSLVVAAVNDAPTAEDLTINTFSGTPVEFELFGADVEGDVASFGIKTKPANGKAALSERDGKWYVVYTPLKDFVGTDTLTYISRDGFLTSVPATVTLKVVKNNPPKLVSLAPKSGKFDNASTVVFTQKVIDSNGVKQLDAVSLLFSSNAKGEAKNGAGLWFDPVNDVFTMTTDDGKSFYTPVALGQTLYNSQVSVKLNKSDISRGNDGTLTIKWRVTFNPTFVGTKTLWSYVEDLGGQKVGYVQQGTITIDPALTRAQQAAASSANES